MHQLLAFQNRDGVSYCFYYEKKNMKNIFMKKYIYEIKLNNENLENFRSLSAITFK